MTPVTTLLSRRRTKVQVFGPGSTSCEEQSTYRPTPGKGRLRVRVRVRVGVGVGIPKGG